MAIVLVVWVSAIASSFIDNIPFTQAMVRRERKSEGEGEGERDRRERKWIKKSQCHVILFDQSDSSNH